MGSFRWPIVFIIPVVAGFIAWIVVLIRKFSKKQRERLRYVAGALGAELSAGSWKEQPRITGQLGGKSYEITFHVVSSGQSSVTYLDLKTRIEPGELKLSVKKLGAFTRLAVKLGLSKPLASGDPYFDRKVAVKGGPEQRILAIMYGPYFKEAATRLAERNYATTVKGEMVVASKVYSRKKDMNEMVLREDLGALMRLAEAVEGQR